MPSLCLGQMRQLQNLESNQCSWPMREKSRAFAKAWDFLPLDQAFIVEQVSEVFTFGSVWLFVVAKSQKGALHGAQERRKKEVGAPCRILELLFCLSSIS